MAVATRFILEGSEYALEQCGLLLRDANVLYQSGSYASAVVLTAFAREELALLWQIYSRRFLLPIHFRQCGHRFGGS
jgi:AbiV family abortive infection protein